MLDRSGPASPIHTTSTAKKFQCTQLKHTCREQKCCAFRRVAGLLLELLNEGHCLPPACPCSSPALGFVSAFIHSRFNCAYVGIFSPHCIFVLLQAFLSFPPKQTSLHGFFEFPPTRNNRLDMERNCPSLIQAVTHSSCFK